MSMWFLVGIDSRHGIGWTVPIWLPLPSASWLPEEAVDEPSAYRTKGKTQETELVSPSTTVAKCSTTESKN